MSGPLPVRQKAARAARPLTSLTWDDVSGHNPRGHRAGIRILVSSKWVHKGYLWLLSLAMAEYGKARAKGFTPPGGMG
jgi:hypothetical protein